MSTKHYQENIFRKFQFQRLRSYKNICPSAFQEERKKERDKYVSTKKKTPPIYKTNRQLNQKKDEGVINSFPTPVNKCVYYSIQ